MILEHQHVRYNPLKDEWILVSPHRALRPWSGQVETTVEETVPKHDPTNPLCPGVKRANGSITPKYESTYVFTNDFPALLENIPEPPESQDDDLFRTRAARGTCKVICFHPRSDVYLYSMTDVEVRVVIEEWVNQTTELGQTYEWVQIFENRGAIMGCSNPHPHCQVWASNFMPNEARAKDTNLRKYFRKHSRPLLTDYVLKELTKAERLVYQNAEWVVLVPYWAVWPFETMVLPKKQIQRFPDANAKQRELLVDALKSLVTKYDNLFKCPFPYSMGWHGAPTGRHLDEDQSHWTFHGSYYPPLLRSASVKKFMVGYELLAQVQRDLTPEKAAAMLREQNDVHYKLAK